jgi:hypothetical protein
VHALAATAPDSTERFSSRARLPSMAKWLREAGPAAPVVASRFIAGSGGDGEASLSVDYGGTASGSSAVSGCPTR